MRRIGDVSVGEQDEFRLDRASLDFGQALAHRRELAGPTRRRSRPCDDLEAMGRLSFARRSRRGGGCAVCALIVDDDHRERPRIVLPKQRADAQSDHVGFVARRDDRDHAGPSVGRVSRRRNHRARGTARTVPCRTEDRPRWQVEGERRRRRSFEIAVRAKPGDRIGEPLAIGP